MPDASTASMRGMSSALSATNCAPRFTYGMCQAAIVSSPVKLANGVDNERKLLRREILMHRQGERRRGVPIRHGEAARRISQVAQTLLAIERDRIVDLAFDSALGA